MQALGDLNHEWTLEDEREFITIYEDMTAEELAQHFDREPEEVIVMALHVRRQERLLREREKAEGVQYDSRGFMKYHKDYHWMQGEPWTMEEDQYICTYIRTDGVKKIGLALGRTAASIQTQYNKLRKNGDYDYYMNRGKEA